MADVDPFRISLLSQNYPTLYDNFLTYLEAYLTEIENARQGDTSLVANLNTKFAQFIVASTGLTVDLDANGKRIAGGVVPVSPDEFVIKSYADGLVFAATLPSQTGNAGKEIITDGTTASWGISAFSALGVLNSIGY